MAMATCEQNDIRNARNFPDIGRCSLCSCRTRLVKWGCVGTNTALFRPEWVKIGYHDGLNNLWLGRCHPCVKMMEDFRESDSESDTQS